MKRKPCDLVLRGVQIFNVFTGETQPGEIAVLDGKICGIGSGYHGEREIDCEGLFAIPGLIDSHIHVESSMLSPEAFAALAVPRGTTGIVADPHELTNVCGIAGAEYLAEAFARLKTEGGNVPLDLYLQLPSCVPATPFETSGASLGGEETAREIARPLFFGLGEMMAFPSVIAGEEDALRKIRAARDAGKPVDGHAPGVSGDALNAYSCAGILTDHEPLSAEECSERVARGMYVQLRNASSARNLERNCKAVTRFNFRRFLLCSDDKNAADLRDKGHLDDALRLAVSCGVPAAEAVCMATSNVAECYGIKGKGALAPGYDADIVLVDDLQSFRVRRVYKRGELVAEAGDPCFSHTQRYFPDAVRSTVHIAPVTAESFRIAGRTGKLRAIAVEPYSLTTHEEIVPVAVSGGDICVKGSDLCKLAVVERHFATGNVGLGVVKGYGFRGGALGITVAHDSHNIVVLGDDNADMARVVALLQRSGGGMALVANGKEEVFPLDIAGLMSSAPADEVIERTREIAAHARACGVKACYEPFMTLVFLSLLVIPDLKLSDKGLFDLTKYSFVDLDA